MPISVTVKQLLAAAPQGSLAIVTSIADESERVFAKYGISNRNRVLAFLSTVLEETGFRTLIESGAYSAERAHEVWPSLFPTPAAAALYVGNTTAFFNKVYNGRMGNVIGSNDGYDFRGQGLLQITGRDNFTLLEKLTGLPLVEHPSLVTSTSNMLECACALFVQYPGILAYADKAMWQAVWALVGSGRANGPVINQSNHQAALASLIKALPLSMELPAAPVPAPAGPFMAASPAPVIPVAYAPPIPSPASDPVLAPPLTWANLPARAWAAFLDCFGIKPKVKP